MKTNKTEVGRENASGKKRKGRIGGVVGKKCIGHDGKERNEEKVPNS